MERIKIFNGLHQYIRDEDRDTVHRQGYWHETIQCWLVDGETVYLQKRSAVKKDFPSVFDITAAGHLLADETPDDGVREIREELGVEIDPAKLQKKGIVKDIIEQPGFSDYEFAHLYVYENHFSPGDFSLQEEEVEGIYAVDRQEFIRLCRRETASVACRNVLSAHIIRIGLDQFVPHSYDYFQTVAAWLE